MPRTTCKKLRKPYVLIMGGQSRGYYKTLAEARDAAYLINKNAFKSGGPEYVKSVKIYNDDHAGRNLVHEEDGKGDFT